jgi:hypothetical protein
MRVCLYAFVSDDVCTFLRIRTRQHLELADGTRVRMCGQVASGR